MNVFDDLEAFNLAKLQMLQALARSQEAVVRIMEHTADAACSYKLEASVIGDQLRALAGYQSTLITQLSGLKPRFPQRGSPPDTPWLNGRIKPSIGAASRHAPSPRRIRKGE